MANQNENMENRIVLELIQKDLDELQILVEALQKEETPNQLLIDISIGRTKTLLQEFSLLQGSETNLPAAKTVQLMEQVAEEISTDENGIEETSNTVIFDQEPETVTILDSEEIAVEEILMEEPVQEQESIQDEEPEEEAALKEENQDEEIEEIIEEEAAQPEEIIEEVPSPVIESEPEVQEEPEAVEETTPVEEIVAEEHEMEMEPVVEEKKVLGEKFVKELTLNERLGSSTSQESKIKGIPVTSLRKAIGLNDKFMFTRELFGNDHDKFEQSISALDNCKNLLQAIDYLEKNFKWTKSETSLKFIALVKQRFSN